MIFPIKLNMPIIKNGTSKMIAKTRLSSKNINAKYPISFRGNFEIETFKDSSVGALNQLTYFFREIETDEIVQDYIRENFKEGPIKIVSGACSSGEEARSYAMMLDDLEDRLEIEGFDISNGAIKKTKEKRVQVILGRVPKIYLGNCSPMDSDFDKERFIVLDESDLTDYQRKCKRQFYKYYKELGERHYVPFKDNLGRDYCVYVQDFVQKDGAFKKCSFRQGNVKNLIDMYDKNSINVLLYRNALYHNLCEIHGNSRFERSDAKEIMNGIAKQMNLVVKEKGLVVLGEHDTGLDISQETIRDCMQNNGFEQYICKGKTRDNVWIKVHNTSKIN